jgi:hypothetical protein
MFIEVTDTETGRSLLVRGDSVLSVAAPETDHANVVMHIEGYGAAFVKETYEEVKKLLKYDDPKSDEEFMFNVGGEK